MKNSPTRYPPSHLEKIRPQHFFPFLCLLVHLQNIIRICPLALTVPGALKILLISPTFP